MGELGVLCQEKEQGVDSKGMSVLGAQKREAAPRDARRAGTADLGTLL